MSRLTSSADPSGHVLARRSSPSEAEGPIPPAAAALHLLQQENADLRRELVALRTQRQRDLATVRGLGEALQSLRRGALALRTENEELHRRLDGRGARRR